MAKPMFQNKFIGAKHIHQQRFGDQPMQGQADFGGPQITVLDDGFEDPDLPLNPQPVTPVNNQQEYQQLQEALLNTTLDSNKKQRLKSPLKSGKAGSNGMKERAKDRQERMKQMKDSDQGGVKGIIGQADKRKRQPSAKKSAVNKENILQEVHINQMQGLVDHSVTDANME